MGKNNASRKENERLKDPGNKGIKKGWANPDFNDSDWHKVNLPSTWENIFNIDGAIWFRKTLEVPKEWEGKEIKISFGGIDDFDITYFNGVQIGKTGEETLNWWQVPRHYNIPASLVKAGKNTIAVRVFDHFGAGGFIGTTKDMKISFESESIDISGEWKYNVEYSVVSNIKPKAPFGPDNPVSPSVLYNGMINPLIPYGIKGVIWYQGESNVGRAYQYRKLLPAMINDWREQWNQPADARDFHFLVVQLSNFMTPPGKPENSAWAELREAQAMTASSLKNCALATTIDIGEEKDIHPRNKQDVGKRLALVALRTAYGKDVVSSGPTYDSMKKEGNKIIITMKNIGSGLVAKDGDLKHFAIAGENKVFVWAKAVIDGNKIIVSSDKVKNPLAVRYAWANNPEGCNLYNVEGLPALPFRTDDWDGVTIDKY